MSTNTMYIYCSTSPVQVESSPRVPCGLAGLGPFGPAGTLETGRTQFFRPPGTLRTGGTQSFQPPRYPVDWRDSVRFAPQVPCGLAGPSPFSPQVPCGLVGLGRFGPPGTLRTESSKMTRSGESLSPEDWYWYSDELCNNLYLC